MEKCNWRKQNCEKKICRGCKKKNEIKVLLRDLVNLSRVDWPGLDYLHVNLMNS